MTTQSPQARPPGLPDDGADPAGRADLDARLDRWVASGLITADQARRIRAAEGVAPAPHAASLVAESLGYVGGVLVLVAAAVIAGRYWSGLGVGGRLAVAFGAALVLAAVGAALPSRLGAADRRLRAVCWALAVAAVAGGLGLVGADVLDLREESVALLAAAGAAAAAAAFWAWHRTVLQQAVLLVALAVTAAAASAHLPRGETEVAGLAVWGVGVVWLLLGWGHLLAPRVAVDVLGGAVAVFGTMLTVSTDWGSGLAISWAVVLVGSGVVLRDLVLLGVGAVATLVTVPVVLNRWFPDTLTAPLALLAVGALLVIAGLQVARRRRAGGPAPHDRGSPRAATVAAAGVGLATTVAVVLLGTV